MTLKLLGIFLALCIPFLIATIWAIVDVAQKDFGTAGKKAQRRSGGLLPRCPLSDLLCI
jgi:hypothetical protein